MEPELLMFYDLVKKASSGGIRTQTQPQNLYSIICLKCKVFWDKEGLELVGVTNQWLVQLKSNAMGGAHAWHDLKSQESEFGYPTEPNTTVKKEEEENSMIPTVTWLYL